MNLVEKKVHNCLHKNNEDIHYMNNHYRVVLKNSKKPMLYPDINDDDDDVNINCGCVDFLLYKHDK